MLNQRPQGFSLLPTIVKNLLIINGLFFVFTVVLENTLHIDIKDYLALYYPSSTEFRPYQFISHLFLHGNLMHLFSNMFALWMFGAALENVWGPKRFLTFYMVTGLGAALLHTFVNFLEVQQLQTAANVFLSNPTPGNFESFVLNDVPGQVSGVFKELMDAWNANPDTDVYRSNAVDLVAQLMTYKTSIPTVGASGAVFGVLLAFGMMFPNAMIYIFFFLPLKAKYFVILYGAFELYNGLQNNPNDNVAHFAHLGGMLFGFILIQLWRKQKKLW